MQLIYRFSSISFYIKQTTWTLCHVFHADCVIDSVETNFPKMQIWELSYHYV